MNGNVYNKIESGNKITFEVVDYLKCIEKKHLYAKVKKHMSTLSEEDAKTYLQNISKNNFLDVLKLEVKLIDMYS